MEEGSSIIRVLNPSPAPIAAYSNQKVGILYPLSEVEGVCALVGQRQQGQQKLGCPDVVKHWIDSGDAAPIQQ